MKPISPTPTRAEQAGVGVHELAWVSLLELAFLRVAAARGWRDAPRRTSDPRGLESWLEEAADQLGDDQPWIGYLLDFPPVDRFRIWRSLQPVSKLPPSEIPRAVVALRGPPAESSGSDRRRRGRYYTPAGIARFVVRETLRLGPGSSPDQILETTVLDLAAGEGVFLEEAAHHLAEAYATRTGASMDASLRAVTTHCLYGVELEAEAAVTCRWTLRLLGARSGHVPDLTGHVLERNALVGASLETFPWPVDPDHPAIRDIANAWTGRCLAPDLPWPRADDGPEAFLEGLTPQLRDEAARMASRMGFLHPWLDLAPVAAGGFRAVVGNPPYLSEVRGGAALFQPIKLSPRTRSDYVHKGDLFHYFMLESLRLLAPGGRAGLLVPPYWRTRASAEPVRKALVASCTGLVRVDFGDVRLFKDAPGHHSEVLVVEKSSRDTPGTIWEVAAQTASPDAVIAALLGGRPGVVTQREVPAEEVLGVRPRKPSRTLPLGFEDDARFRIPAKDISQGLIMPQATLSARGLERLPPGSARVGAGIFWLRDEELEALRPTPEERRLAKPYVPAGCIRPFYAGRRRGWVLYLDQEAREALERYPDRYAALRAHLDRFAPAITSSHGPYQLHRARSPHWFEGSERVLVVRKAPRVIAARTNGPCYVDQSVNVIVVPNASQARYLVALLSSRSIGEQVAVRKTQGRMVQVDKEVLTAIELPRAPKPTPGQRETVRAWIERMGWAYAVEKALPVAQKDRALTRAVIETLEDRVESLLRDAARPPSEPEGWQARPGRGGWFASDLPARLPEVERLCEALDQLVMALE